MAIKRYFLLVILFIGGYSVYAAKDSKLLALMLMLLYFLYQAAGANKGLFRRKEIASVEVIETHSTKTLDCFISKILDQQQRAERKNCIYTENSKGELYGISLGHFVHGSLRLAKFLKKNASAAEKIINICDDPIFFATIDAAGMVLNRPTIPFPETVFPHVVNAVLTKEDNVLVICSSTVAHSLATSLTCPCEVFVTDNKIPSRDFGTFYGSSIRFQFISEIFLTESDAENDLSSLRYVPFSNEAADSHSLYSVLWDYDDTGKELRPQNITQGDFLRSIDILQAKLTADCRSGVMWIQSHPLAFRQQRSLFYAMICNGMDIVLLQTPLRFDHPILSSIKPQCASVPLDAILRVYSDAVASAKSIRLFRTFPCFERGVYLFCKKLRSFYYFLGLIHRGNNGQWTERHLRRVFIPDEAPLPSNVVDLIEGCFGCTIFPTASVKEKDRVSDKSADGPSISQREVRAMGLNASVNLMLPNKTSANALYLESVYRVSPFVSEIFLTNSQEKNLIAVIHPDRAALIAAMRRADPVEWHDIQTAGKKLILSSLKKIRRIFHLPKACTVEEAVVVAYSFTEHKSLRGVFRKYIRPNVVQYYAEALQAASASQNCIEGTKIVGETPSVLSELISNRIGESSRHFRFPCSIDIGGTSCKIVFFEPKEKLNLPAYCVFERLSVVLDVESNSGPFWTNDQSFLEASKETRKVLRFMRLPTEKVPQFIEFLYSKRRFMSEIQSTIVALPATGGGASRFRVLIKEKLGFDLLVRSEFQTAISGLNFLLETIPNEVVYYDLETDTTKPAELGASAWPYLLVNVGSGMSILECTSAAPGDFRRVSGSALGGGTFWGLCKLITKATTWEEINEMTRVDGPGDAANVDLLVRDIYGCHSPLPGSLEPDTLASSFGKVACRGARVSPKASDYVRSLLIMMSNNITQISFLWAQILGIQNIYFCGGFLQNNPVVMRHIVQSMEYWTREKPIVAKFVRHNGYLGAIGGLVGASSIVDLAA